MNELDYNELELREYEAWKQEQFRIQEEAELTDFEEETYDE